eukprot:100168-Rhodomonas_salina.2
MQGVGSRVKPRSRSGPIALKVKELQVCGAARATHHVPLWPPHRLQPVSYTHLRAHETEADL